MAGGSGSNGGRTRNGAAASTEAASGGTATTVAALVVLLAVASLLVLLLSPTPVAMRADGDGVGVPHEPVELAFGLAGHESWLDAVRAWAKLALLKLRPPEPRYDLRSPASVKKAARESLEMGKQAVEHAAESAAETLGKTTVKLKRKVSPPPGRHLDGDL
ncbi:uncharacterized protein LOC121054967 isoform X1 [Oryza brachyantha]|uniref:uncharacterized protein LOC121054967 isoform X1 n=1 Tax=Oryza brachyantha TaxID=4533 RepID=UPI001ADB932A|nr:uncharacterized protein LOC121054967 isoform X1 [Oryza brachyantha]